MKAFCNIKNDIIEKLSRDIDKDIDYTTNLVSTWQTVNQSIDYPTADELKSFKNNIGTINTRQKANTEYSRLNLSFGNHLRDRVSYIARAFSDIVDALVDNEIQATSDAINTELASDNPDTSKLRELYNRSLMINDSVLGRRAMIQYITVPSIIDKIKSDIQETIDLSDEDLKETYGDNAEYVKNEYKKIIDNFDPLFNEASITIGNVENLQLSVNKHTYFIDNDSKAPVLDAAVSESKDTMDINEDEFGDDTDDSRISGNDGWSYNVRYIDPRKTISRTTRNALNNIVREDSDGNTVMDDLGNVKYLNPEYAHAVLINELSDMITPDNFSQLDANGNIIFPALQNTIAKYPWVNQVINTLNLNPNYISSFYADFRKDFIPYWMQEVKKDATGTIQLSARLNTPIAMDSTMSTMIDNYEQGNILDGDSIYDNKKLLNKEHAAKGIELTNSILNRLNTLDTNADNSELLNDVSKALKMIGYNASAEDTAKSSNVILNNLLKSEEGPASISSITQSMLDIFNGVSKDNQLQHLINSFNNEYKNIASIVGTVSELNNMQSFRIGKDTMYSYSAPNYMDTQLKLFKSDLYRQNYIDNNFKKYNWFYDNNTGKWRNQWLNLIESDPNVRFQMENKELKAIQRENGQIVPYDQWTPKDTRSILIKEYYSIDSNPKSKYQYAYYTYPIFSDSPVSKFIKFVKYEDDVHSTFEDKLKPLFRDVVKQELSRMALIENRKNNNITPIANFDKTGTKFCFFPRLNNYTVGDMSLKDACQNAINNNNISDLNSIIDNAVEASLNEGFNKFLGNGSEDEDTINYLLQQGIISDSTSDSVNRALKEYYWNHAYAESQITQLMTTDIAYYKDMTDFQKRFKEVYAAGTKLNTNSKYGKKFEKTFYIKDNIVTSTVFNKIKEIINNAVSSKAIDKATAINILDSFKNINIADAQAYRSLDSMRSIMDMMGTWDDNMENTFNRIKDGKFEFNDLFTVWQTLKPFVYTQIDVPNGLGGSIKVPQQNKNSEFLLLASHAVIAGLMKNSPKLRAINDFMLDNDIDVVQFESAVKTGNQATVDMSYSKKKLDNFKESNGSYKAIDKAAKSSLGDSYDSSSDYEKFKAGCDKLLDKGKISQESYNSLMESIEPDYDDAYDAMNNAVYLSKNDLTNKDGSHNVQYDTPDSIKKEGDLNPEVVHTLPYDDYCIQQPTPEHLFDVKAVFGSQIRNLNVSDLPTDPNFRIGVNGKNYTRKDFLDLYHSLIISNVVDGYNKAINKISSIDNLQKTLLETINGNTDFNADIADALQLVNVINPDTGVAEKEFNIPLVSPNNTIKIQQIINSLFSNNVTKQNIKGGACIMVSGFGYSKDLHLLYNDKNELKGAECYLPAYSKSFYEPFLRENENGTYELDINALPEDLRRAIGYRIPTEDKYSILPLIIKGFMPQQNGSSIMVPPEITQIAGSDFDVDKMFMMLPEFDIETYNKEGALNDYNLNNGTNADLSDDSFNKWFLSNKEDYKYATPKISKVKYDETKSASENTLRARNNQIIDMMYGVMSNADTQTKFLNPGNFDLAKKAAKVSIIMQDPNLLDIWSNNHAINTNSKSYIKDLYHSINAAKLSELKKFISTYAESLDPLSPETYSYFHSQNMTGAALKGIFANNTTMQAKMQDTDLGIRSQNSFMINGRTISSLHDVTSGLGERISKNCANFSAASVDNAKDPTLADLMQGTKTANVTGLLLRAGVSIPEIGLLFSQPIVKRCIKETGSLDKILDYINKAKKYLDSKLGTKSNITLESSLKHNFTSDELSRNVLFGSMNRYTDASIDTKDKVKAMTNTIKSAFLMHNINYISKDLNALTQISRADSPNGSIASSLAGLINQKYKVKLFNDLYNMNKLTLTGVDAFVKNNYTKNKSGDINSVFDNSPISMLQAFYTLGIDRAEDIIKDYFPTLSDESLDAIDYLQKNSANGILNDKTLNAYFKDLVTYCLTSSKLFGNDDSKTYEEKRDYYLNDFPSEFMNILAHNKDIANLNAMKKLTVKNGALVMQNSSKISPIMRDALVRDFDSLMYMDNPNASKLAKDLFMYAFYKDGLSYTPNGYSKLLSTDFVSKFPEYISTLRNIKNILNNKATLDRFTTQFYLNNANNGSLITTLTNAKVLGDYIRVDTSKVMNTYGGIKDIVSFHNDLYTVSFIGSELAMYSRISKILGSGIYNINSDGSDIYDRLQELGNERQARIDQQKAQMDQKTMADVTSSDIETPDLYMPDINDSFDFANELDDIADEFSNFANEGYDTEESNNLLKEPLC